jgi:hypothetical protein
MKKKPPARAPRRLLAKLAIAAILRSAGIRVEPRVYVYDGRRVYGYGVRHRTAAGESDTGNIQWTFDNALHYAFATLAIRTEDNVYALPTRTATSGGQGGTHWAGAQASSKASRRPSPARSS